MTSAAFTTVMPRLRTALFAAALAARVACAMAQAASADADARTDTKADAQADKQQALAEFVPAYRLANLWPQMVPKIARDSLPRLEDAARADIDADPLPDDAHRASAQARVASLLPQGRQDLETALHAFDADELAAYTALEVYGKLFETQEIRQITAFFDSATGRKLNALAPTLLTESRQPGAVDVMARHFSTDELAEIAAFWNSPVGHKMNSTAGDVREAMHEHFIARSEPALQAVARTLAARAEAEASPAPAPPSDAASSPAP